MAVAFAHEMRRQGLGIAEVASRAGVDPATVGHFVGQRRTRPPSNRVLKALQMALNLPDDFFDQIETPVSPVVQDRSYVEPVGKDLNVNEREIVAKAADLMLQAARINSEAARLLASIAQQSPPPPPLDEVSTS